MNIEPVEMWAITTQRNKDGDWFICGHTISYYRSDAIHKYNEVWIEPNIYKRELRKGLAKAIRVTVSATTEGE